MASLPASYAAVPKGVWTNLRGTEPTVLKPFADALSSHFGGLGIEGFSAIWNDWTSACLDPEGTLYIPAQGGHQGFGGNGILAFHLGAKPADAKWRMARPHSRLAGPKTVYEPLDGGPRSAHGYGTVEWLDNIDAAFLIARYGFPLEQLWAARFPAHGPWLWHRDLNEWQPLNGMPALGGPDPFHSVVFDRARGLLYIVQTNSTAFDPTNGKFSTPWPVAPGSYGTMAYSEKDRVAVRFHAAPGQEINIIDYANPDRPKAQVMSLASIPGEKPSKGPAQVGWTYASWADAFVGWGGGREVALFDHKLHRFKVLPNLAGEEPTKSTSPNGVYGRFRAWDKHEVFIATDAWNGPVSLYRLP
jgi:hypothetical protein